MLSLSLRETFTEEVIFRTLMLRNCQGTEKRVGFCRKAAHPQPWGAEGAAPVSGAEGKGGGEVERCKKRLLDQLMKDLLAMLRKWNFILTIITLKNYNKGRSIIKFTITTARGRLAWRAFKGRNWETNYWESPGEKG